MTTLGMSGRSSILTAATTSLTAGTIILVLLIGAALPAASAQAAPRQCGNGLVTSRGCESPASVTHHLNELLRGARNDFGLKAAIARVDAGNQTLLRSAIGRSQQGVAASPPMHFRIGSMTIPWLTTIVLQLRDEGRLSLKDRISRWFPGFPRASQVTVGMLTNSTSGYFDYIQGNQPFIDGLHVNPFRRWTGNELLETALSRGFRCDPGSCFNYAHTNYILLARLVQKVTGRTMTNVMNRRILRPLGLSHTQLTSKAAIPAPALHAFTAERGFYEDSTTWSPSWGLGSGTLATSTIDDIARAARPIFTGKLLSRKSHREMVAPTIAGFPPFSDTFYYGMGLIVKEGWRLQNPFFNGYMGVTGYLPRRNLSISLIVTNNLPGSFQDLAPNPSAQTFSRLAAYLAPEVPPLFPPAP